MKTQEILSRVHDAMSICQPMLVAEDSRSYNAESIARDMLEALRGLSAELEAQLRMECNASRGNLNAARTVARILRDARKGFREALHYAWIDGDGRQCICDGFQAYRMKNHLTLEERPESAGDPIDLDRIIPSTIPDGYAAVPFPAVSELKAFDATERAKWTGKKSQCCPLWDFGPGLPAVQVAYLLNAAAIFPNATEIFVKNHVSALYIRCEDGDAIILPVRDAKKIAAENAAKVESERAKAELEDRAAKKGVDPDAMTEDEKRRSVSLKRDKEALEHTLNAWREEAKVNANGFVDVTLEQLAAVLLLMKRTAYIPA